jgi:hypothetical protein
VSAPEHVVAALLPQALPEALFAPSTHTDDPVEQDVVPALHGVGLVVQAAPGTHEPHTPALQYRFDALDGPHILPSASTVPVSTQTGVPDAQDNFPAWHALAGVHVPPSLHVTQLPALQTIPVIPAGEQDVPAGLFPDSTHTDDPVAQDVAPVLHTFAG